MLQNVDYCPILHARVAEIKALFHLPAQTKDRLLPLIVARPWPNAKSLFRTWEKIQEAMGDRRFAVDLDQTKFGSGGAEPASSDFDALFRPDEGFENYYGELVDLPRAVPVIRLLDGGLHQFEQQLEHIEALDRGAVLRLHVGRVPQPITIAEQVLGSLEDVAIIIDAGWSRDVLLQEAWASAIIAKITELRPEVEIVVAGSSFPDSFTNVGPRGTLAVHERSLHANLVRQHNAAQIVYGDWGSTRPPVSESVPMRNTPRIDLPTARTWICFRKDGAETYPDIARRLMLDPEWPSQMNIWGTYTIECTASEVPGAIRSPGTAAAARINLHMHRQANFEVADEISDGDEPFTDD